MMQDDTSAQPQVVTAGDPGAPATQDASGTVPTRVAQVNGSAQPAIGTVAGAEFAVMPSALVKRSGVEDGGAPTLVRVVRRARPERNDTGPAPLDPNSAEALSRKRAARKRIVVIDKDQLQPVRAAIGMGDSIATDRDWAALKRKQEAAEHMTVAELLAAERGEAYDGDDADDDAQPPLKKRRGRNKAGKLPGGTTAERGPRGPKALRQLAAGEGKKASKKKQRAAGGKPAAAQAMPRPADTAPLLASLVSGSFDAEPAVDAPAPQAPAKVAARAKRVLEPADEAPKLHKLLAQIGIASRREIEELIMAGRISVNGEPAHLGQRIVHTDQVRLNGKPIKLPVAPPKTRVLLYHKPVGEVTTTRDPEGRPTVFDQLPQIKHARWVTVGRLDINTEGLLLFTTNGELANRLMHPRFGIEREYAVRVLGELDEATLERLRQGVDLDDGPAAFKSIEPVGGEGANRWYRVTIAEGRNREVRRLIEAVGHSVSRLIRLRYAHIPLPPGLRRGQWAELEERDAEHLLRLVDLGGQVPRQRGAAGKQAARGRHGQAPRAALAAGDGRAARKGGGARGIPSPLQQTHHTVVERPSEAMVGPEFDDELHDRQPRAPGGPSRRGARKRPRKGAGHAAGAPMGQAAAAVGAESAAPDPRARRRPARKPRAPAGDHGHHLQAAPGERPPQPDGAQRQGRGAQPKRKPNKPAPRQPDPLQTSLTFLQAPAGARRNRRRP
jgi:23S rRNA pseudouridine2605 synthase